MAIKSCELCELSETKIVDQNFESLVKRPQPRKS